MKQRESRAPGRPGKSIWNRRCDAELYEREILEYKKAMGKDHGLTPEQIHIKMQSLMADPVFQNRFLGILTLQTPSDAWNIMEIMCEVKPDLWVKR